MIFSIAKHVDEYEKERIGLNVKNKGVIGERTQETMHFHQYGIKIPQNNIFEWSPFEY